MPLLHAHAALVSFLRHYFGGLSVSKPQIKQTNYKQTAEISDQIQNLLRQTQTMPETNGCGKPHVVPRPSAMKKPSAIKPFAIENAKSDIMQVQVTIENQNVDRQQNTEDIMI